MNEIRKRAYRILLYEAMLDIRAIAWLRLTFWQRFNPYAWARNQRQVRRAGVIADYLHNLARFSAYNFEHFSEDFFWQDWQSACERYPDFGLQVYKDRFDKMLSESLMG